MQNIFLGIDGCKAGWATIEIIPDPKLFNSKSESWDFHLFPTITYLFEHYQKLGILPDLNSVEENHLTINCTNIQILIDIPIGLKESGPIERKCDSEARAFLGPKRGSSVFRVQVRKTVYCSDTYEETSKINYDMTTKKISKQTYYICKKIREVDEFICSKNSIFDITSVLHESHPEVVFTSLAGTQLLFPKRTKAGFIERMKIIKEYNNSIESFISDIYKNFKKDQVQPDDILDASVLAVAAKNIFLTGKIKRFPAEPEIDNKRISMEIISL